MKSIAKIQNFIKKQKVVFIASIDNNGFPNQKAMLRPRKIEGGMKTFYFSTNTSSMRAAQFRHNPNASIYFYHKGLIKYEGVMLTGTMEILEDASRSRIVEKGTQVKMARGEMVRFMAEKQIEAAEEIKSFNRLGYSYSKELSDGKAYVFVKERLNTSIEGN